MTIQDKITAFQLSFCCAILDRIRRNEKARSARWNAVNNLEERFQKTLDLYRVEKWQTEDLEKASALFDTMERKIKKLFPGS